MSCIGKAAPKNEGAVLLYKDIKDTMGVLKNARHEAYVQNLIRGMSQRQAYIAAYEKAATWKPETVDKRASELLKNGEVLGRYEELQKASATASCLTRAEKREMLAALSRDLELSPQDRMKAIEIDNKMEGEYETNVNLNTPTEFTISLED